MRQLFIWNNMSTPDGNARNMEVLRQYDGQWMRDATIQVTRDDKPLIPKWEPMPFLNENFHSVLERNNSTIAIIFIEGVSRGDEYRFTDYLWELRTVGFQRQWFYNNEPSLLDTIIPVALRTIVTEEPVRSRILSYLNNVQ